ncbi:5'/3'-nucleotidase SurE [Rhodoblastus sphagnicola]|uniref:5'-nucleotidase SurE n=1 Tax=Rhodoblastus sphagnicola TaxID=333368 RepID=A0A2S6NHJ1_9HYPH|nr:5'/3'-nucleotidase SurE [Rhodoblastus sphagnicola]MBB4196254.1 5'-nucleotidase [Rhodoblastus sphagnicola]PPQ34115.1 5'/3'-nucleotidase SurE [Rhodoblastus sphagnicola]
MRILITNDDGIHAPGLAVLERIARSLSEDVVVVAPESDQSGVAHSLSLSDPLRLRKVSDNHFAVKGTPTDCIIMGVRKIMVDNPPDLILSGVNRGQNVAEDVTYSGTIAGAMEGTLLGFPSIALSQCYVGENSFWPCTETHAAPLIEKIVARGFPPGVLINLNFPACTPEEVQGVSLARQGRREQELMKIEGRRDGRGNPYYWIAFERPTFIAGKGTDLEAVAQNRISVTPLRLDLTDEPALAHFASLFG